MDLGCHGNVDYIPVTISKSYEVQREDFLTSLSNNNPLFSGDIKNQWKNILELTVEPIGWNALWKLSEEYCSKLGILYPKFIVVEVQNVDFDNLQAAVSVLIAEDNVDIPKIVPDVPLIQLFPTTKQDYDYINSVQTASILHDLRFFYNYLWYPWDERLNVNEDWVLLHFEDRLKLHYDILSEEIPPSISLKTENIRKECEDVYNKIVELEEQLNDLDDIDISFNEHNDSHHNTPSENDISRDELNVSDSITPSEVKFLLLNELNTKLVCLSEHLNFHEKKHVRNLLEITKDSILNEKDSKIMVCCKTFSNFSTFTNRIANINLPAYSSRFQCSNSLDKLLCKSSNLRDMCLFLDHGSYTLNEHTTFFLKSCLIKGLDHHDDVVLCDSKESIYLFDFDCDESEIANLSFNTEKVKHVLFLRSGKCVLNNIKFVNNSENKIGIFVAKGSKLIADNCYFYNFSTVIQANKDSSVEFTNCLFENNINCINFEQCHLSIDSCQFINNKGKALFMNTSESLEKTIKTGNNVLEEMEGVKIIDSIFKGNNIDMAAC